jgi:hypothetical protein
MKKAILLLIVTLSITGKAAPTARPSLDGSAEERRNRSAKAPSNFKMINGVIYDIYARGSRWRELQAEATGLHTNGTIVRQFGFQEVHSREAKTVRAKVYGLGEAPGAVIGTTKVYGATLFLYGHKLLLGERVPLRTMAMPVGQANINGVMMEVWKTGTTPTAEQIRDWQMTHQSHGAKN